MNILIRSAIALLITMVTLLAAAATWPPLETVPSVNLERYLGRWHQIAYYPNFFQRDCTGATTAEYSKRDDGMLRVINTCRTAAGDKRAEGVARIVGPAKLEVRFAPAWLSLLPIVWGDYWVIDLDPDYTYAAVGEPSREYLWILARSPTLDEATFQRIAGRLLEQGYDPARLVRTAP